MNVKQKIEYLRNCLFDTLETYRQVLNNRPDFPNRVRWLFDERNEISSLATTLHDAEIITDAEYFDALKQVEKYV